MRLHGWMVLLLGFWIGAGAGYLALSFIYLDWWFFLSDKASRWGRVFYLLFIGLTGWIGILPFIDLSFDIDMKNRDRKRRELGGE